MTSYRQVCKEFNDYPTYKKAYINAFQKMIDGYDDEKRRKMQNWHSGEDVFDWWIEKYKHEVKGQYSLFDEDIYG